MVELRYYYKKIAHYRKRAIDQKAVLFLDFLETLVEWFERLYELKRISLQAKKSIDEAFPQGVLNELEKIVHTKLSAEKYIQLKKRLFDETTTFIYTIILEADIQLKDFDLLQFNLYQIFGKEELASMIEWSRLRLQQEIEHRAQEKEAEKKKKEQEKKEHSRYIHSLSLHELRQRAIALLFDFQPSARTPDERLEAIQNNKQKINSHHLTFHKFEEKLVNATTLARRNAQSTVYRSMGEVTRHIEIVSGKFREKAQLFVSDEGPRKQISEANKRISEKSIVLRKNVTNIGKDWEHEFMIDVASARDRISTSAGRISEVAGLKKVEWGNKFRKKIDKAQNVMWTARDIFEQKRKTKQSTILDHEKTELSKASLMITHQSQEFAHDVADAKQLFAGKGKTILEKQKIMDAARSDFIQKRDTAAKKFVTRGSDIETEMYGTIYEGRNLFQTKRDAARQQFTQRAEEISITATDYLGEKKKAFQKKHIEAGNMFRNDAQTKEREEKTGSEKARKDMTKKAVLTKKHLATAHETIMTEGMRRREKMQDRMKQQRDLFQYDVRFAQYRIKKNAVDFGEKIAAKQEEFTGKGKLLVARHKAKQKSRLINNMLRMIRATH